MIPGSVPDRGKKPLTGLSRKRISGVNGNQKKNDSRFCSGQGQEAPDRTFPETNLRANRESEKE